MLTTSRPLKILYDLFPYNGENDTRSSKNNGKDNKFEYNILIVADILNLVKNKSEDNCIANKKFTSCYKIKI